MSSFSAHPPSNRFGCSSTQLLQSTLRVWLIPPAFSGTTSLINAQAKFMELCQGRTDGNWMTLRHRILSIPPAGGVYIPRFQNLDTVTNPKFCRGFAFQGAIGRGYVPDDSPAIFGIMGFGETLPATKTASQSISRRRDAWGIPVPHINCQLSENEREMLREQVKSIQEMVRACGYKIIFSGWALGLRMRRTYSPMPIGSAGSCFESHLKKAWQLEPQFTSVAALEWETIPPSLSLTHTTSAGT